MHRWLAALVFAACLLAAQGAQALGLGEITTRSALNEPMDAEIALLGATPDELTTLEVRLASRDTFDRYGIDKPSFLNNFRFKLRGGANPAIEITSTQPVTDPFVTMLVEAVWPRGRLLREYTVLLDPPTYAAPQAQTTAPAPVRRTPPPQRESRSSGAVQRSSAPAPARLEGDQYRVQRNDTLWEIAERVRPDESVSINQVMLAIFEANPEAFDGNINRLNAGAVLRLPSSDSLYNVNRSAALQEVRRQMQDWRGDSSGTLVLTPPEEGAGVSGPSTASTRPAATGTSAASSAELEQLRRELAERDRQLQIQNEEMARLQQQLANQDAAAAAAAAEAAEEAPVSTQDLYADTDDAAEDDDADPAAAEAGDDTTDGAADGIFAESGDGADTTTTADAADDSADDAAEEASTRPAPAAVVTTPEEPSLFESLLNNVYAWVIAGVALLGGVALIYARRKGADDDATGTWEALDSADLEDLDGTLAATGRLRDIGSAKRADTSTTAEQPALDSTDSFEATAPVDEIEPTAEAETIGGDEDTSAGYSLDDTFSSETAINLDQSDPLAEADFHMAYGLYDQAADLVKGALAVDPSDNRLKAKLAEIYFVWGNQDGFVAAAEDLKSGVDASDPEWNKVVIMGQQIAPAHALFSGAVASSEGGDLDLSLDETRATPASIDAEIGGDDDGFGEVFDTATADADDDGTVEQVAADISGIDFEFDESMVSDDDKAAAGDTSASGVDFEFDGDALEDGTIEQPVDLGDLGGADEGSATAEIDISDLDLDTGDLESSLGDAADDISGDLLEATGVTSVLPDDFKVSLPDAPADDEETVLADTSAFSDATLEMPSDGANDATSEMPAIDITGEMPAFDETDAGDATAIRPAGAIGDVDLDVADLTTELAVDDLGDADATREQPQVDAGSTLFSEEVFAGDEGVDPNADTGLNLAIDSEDTGNTNVAEVGTKLDLARAYVDMGDPDGARSILEEVLQEGDDEQKGEAQKLLDSLG
ncbi:MAG: FimV/HubP family polar landmark protein [Pseudomonadota bacterium]